MDTTDKIYASILNERLKEETGKILGEEQFEFRSGRGTIDAIYTLNYIVNKKLAKKRGKVYAFFADLKAAFDKMDKKELGEMLKKTGISKQLRERIMGTYKETKNVVKIGNRKVLDRKRSKAGMPHELCVVQCVYHGSRKRTEERAGRRNSSRQRKIMDDNVCERHCLISRKGTGSEGVDQEVQEIHWKERTGYKRRKVEGDGIREGKRTKEKKRMEMGRRRYRRGERDEISRLYNAEERRCGETYSRKNEKGYDGDEADMEYRREIIQG